MHSRFGLVLTITILALAAVSVTAFAQSAGFFNTNFMVWRCDNPYAIGQQGIQFTCGASNLTVGALGRGTPSGHPLTASHTIRVWDVSTQTQIASAVVDGNSPVTSNGFAYATLQTPITLVAGHSYRIASTEHQYDSNNPVDLFGYYYWVPDSAWHTDWGTIDGTCFVWENQNQPGGFDGAYPDSFYHPTADIEVTGQPTFFVN